MPVELYFAVYQCECGEIFKKERTYMQHRIRLNHREGNKYTIIVSLEESLLKAKIKAGVAHTGYKAKREEVSSPIGLLRWKNGEKEKEYDC